MKIMGVHRKTCYPLKIRVRKKIAQEKELIKSARFHWFSVFFGWFIKFVAEASAGRSKILGASSALAAASSS